MNTVALIGRLGADPEVKHTQGGEAVAHLRVAFEQGKDRPTGWIGVVCWGKTAEAVAQYVHKGDEVGVEGRLSYREWEPESGGKRTVLEVAANRVDFLRKKGEALAATPAHELRSESKQAPLAEGDPFGS